jgi:NDP-sugar pyrophosphorylase family protein
MVGDVYLPALLRGARLAVWLYDGVFHDIGNVRGYLDANEAWLSEGGRRSFVGVGARVAPDVALERAVIGEGAVVAGAGTVARAVVWPGATATAPLRRAVVTARGVVSAEHG